MKSRYYYLFLLFLMICASCTSKIIEKKFIFSSKNQGITKQRYAPPLTIWVHGTRAFFSKYFFKNFFYCLPSLHPATKYETKYHLRSIAELLCNNDPYHFHFDTFYFFGWNGKLSFKERKNAARELYQELQTAIQEYKKKYNHEPFIRIIAHSHGGNVVLNMAKIKDNDSFVIDELVLLACPIQAQTICFANHSMFKAIYSLYSKSDVIQILDPQGFYYWQNKNKMPKPEKFLSARCFPESCINVKQVSLTLNGWNLMHIDFLFHKFLQFLPDIITELKNWEVNNTNQKQICLKTE